MRNAQRTVGRATFAAVALFVAIMGGLGGYWAFYQRPEQRCEAQGNWWDPQSRQCGTVVYIPDLTGRYVIDGQPYQPQGVPNRTAPQPAG